MGKIGYGYGSEWHMLWYLGRHRTALDERIRSVAGATSVEWLDFPTSQRRSKLIDGEWKGLQFITEPEIQSDWTDFWPQGAGIQNWDAIGRVRVGAHDEWLLVEAKAHRAELGSSCGRRASFMP